MALFDVFGLIASGCLIVVYVFCGQAGVAPPRARNFLFGGAKKKVTKEKGAKTHLANRTAKGNSIRA
ncbi:hypothetical protein, partial [Lacisediminimonas sp.]|uniref:hypothetical protein n=1 Tax=Lacisediminimonas sp. TaxID=3060582 RepID=UPI002720B9EB